MALAEPSVARLVESWSVQPLAILVALGASAWYVRRVRRTPGWPAGRSALFALGIVLFIWTTCGFPQVYSRALFWVWTAQTLGLLLVVPVLLLAGRPVSLAGSGSGIDRLTRSPFGRTLANPLVGPALVPVLAFAVFFGPLPGWVSGAAPVGWVLHLVLLALGLGITLPLTDDGDQDVASLAVGFAMAVGVLELLIDAVPGIVLRLYASPASTFWEHRVAHPWSPTPLHDQQSGGAILWSVAELLDLPFLIMVFRRWVRADAAEAARVDSVLDAERVVRSARTEGADADAPWWLSDPTMRERFKR